MAEHKQSPLLPKLNEKLHSKDSWSIFFFQHKKKGGLQPPCPPLTKYTPGNRREGKKRKMWGNTESAQKHKILRENEIWERAIGC